jgi:hypothetical protein
MKTTLGHYYAKRKKENADQYPDFFDGDLKRIFSGEATRPKREHGAAWFMKRHRKEIVESVAYWTGERKFTISSLVRKLIQRSESLNLRVGKSEPETTLELAAYLATLVTNYLFTGKFKRTV